MKGSHKAEKIGRLLFFECLSTLACVVLITSMLNEKKSFFLIYIFHLIIDLYILEYTHKFSSNSFFSEDTRFYMTIFRRLSTFTK